MDFPAVTKERVEATLDAMELRHYRDDDDDICVAFDNAFFYFRVDDNMAFCFGTWGGMSSDEELSLDMGRFTNRMNSSMVLGTAVPVSTEGGDTIRIGLPLLMSEGVTDEQLSSMLDTFFQVSFSAFSMLEEQYPQLVTWGEEEN